MNSAKRSNYRREKRPLQMQRRSCWDGTQQLSRIFGQQPAIARGAQDDAYGSADLDFHFTRSLSRARVVTEKNIGPIFLRPRQSGQFACMKFRDRFQSDRTGIRCLNEVNEIQTKTNARAVLLSFLKDDFRAENHAHISQQLKGAQLIQMNQRAGIENTNNHFTTPRGRCVESRRECRLLRVAPCIARGSLSAIPNPHLAPAEGNHRRQPAAHTTRGAAQAALPGTGQSPAAGGRAGGRAIPESLASVRSCRDTTRRPRTFQPQFFPA